MEKDGCYRSYSLKQNKVILKKWSHLGYIPLSPPITASQRGTSWCTRKSALDCASSERTGSWIPHRCVCHIPHYATAPCLHFTVRGGAVVQRMSCPPDCLHFRPGFAPYWLDDPGGSNLFIITVTIIGLWKLII